MAETNIGSLIRELEDNYIDQNVQSGKYVSFDMHETIETIYAYLNSKHISGDVDDMGRDKPFFNIVTAASNIWYRATDIDRKNIRIKANKKEDVLKAFIATVHLQEFMRREAFGAFLNDWGLQLARYGSSVLKFVEKGGRLHSEVIPWNRLIVDPVNFEANPVIEVLELTPAQLRKNKAYDQEMVEALIDSVSSRENLDGQQKDNRKGYIKVYEIHGELPTSYLSEQGDEDDYVQQMHVISFVKSDSGYDDFTLVKGKEKNPYLITHLIKEQDRTLGIGAVEHLFQSQWMVNHSQKAIKDHLDLASKLVFQTSDGSFASRNVLKSIESGDILVHAINQPLTQMNNSSHDITQTQNWGSQWQNLAKEITSTPDAIAGNTFPSGTAYRQVAALQNEAHSLFEIMTENKGLAIEEILRTFIIPFIVKKMDTTEEIAATLDEQGLQKIDSIYIPNQAVKNVNRKIIEKALNEGKATFQNEQEMMMTEETSAIKKELALDGEQRFIKPSEISTRTWKDEMDGFEWDVEVEVTGETTDKEARLTTLTTLFQIIVGKQGQPMSQDEKTIFHKILREAGEVSPIELQTEEQPQTQPASLVPQASPEIGGGLSANQ